MQLDLLGPEQVAPKDHVLKAAEMAPEGHVLESAGLLGLEQVA